MGVQIPFGAGAMVATHASTIGAWGRLCMPKVEDAAGYGTEAGTGGGEAIIYGVNT